MIKEKLEEAMSIKDNDVNSFVWKFAKNKSTNVQEEIALVDATDEQLQTFYNHCMSMLYSEDKVNPGRYVLLEMLKKHIRNMDYIDSNRDLVQILLNG